jgi:glutamyl-tRNA synthetase
MPWLVEVVKTLRERARTLVEMADQAAFYFRDDFAMEDKAVRKHLNPAIKDPLEMLVARLEASPDLDEKGLEEIFRDIIAQKGIKLGALAQAARVALTGRAVSPGIFEVMAILGKDVALHRLAKAIRTLGEAPDQPDSL